MNVCGLRKDEMMKLTREQSAIYQSIKQYSPDSAKRYKAYISSANYALDGTPKQRHYDPNLSNYSLKQKQRIINRIQYFSDTLPGNCAVCLNDVPPPKYREINSDIFCCGNCRYIGKKLLRNGLWDNV